MKKLNKAVIIISKIAEVGYWIVCGFMFLMMIVTATGHKNLLQYLSNIDKQTELSIGGFEISLADGLTDPQTIKAFILFFITGILVSTLMAMVFRNIYLVFKLAKGESKYAKGATPFQSDTVRMVREIGIFCISAPIVEFVMSIISEFVMGDAGVEISVNFNGIVVGMIVLCLSQFFVYGAELQKDTDGLV